MGATKPILRRALQVADCYYAKKNLKILVEKRWIQKQLYQKPILKFFNKDTYKSLHLLLGAYSLRREYVSYSMVVSKG